MHGVDLQLKKGLGFDVVESQVSGLGEQDQAPLRGVHV